MVTPKNTDNPTVPIHIRYENNPDQRQKFPRPGLISSSSKQFYYSKPESPKNSHESYLQSISTVATVGLSSNIIFDYYGVDPKEQATNNWGKDRFKGISASDISSWGLKELQEEFLRGIRECPNDSVHEFVQELKDKTLLDITGKNKGLLVLNNQCFEEALKKGCLSIFFEIIKEEKPIVHSFKWDSSILSYISKMAKIEKNKPKIKKIIEIRDANDMSAFESACFSEDLSIVKELYDLEPDTERSLQFACRTKEGGAKADFLLEKRIDRLALHYACNSGLDVIVKKIMNVSPNSTNQELLNEAMKCSFFSVALLLMKKDRDLKCSKEYKEKFLDFLELEDDESSDKILNHLLLQRLV